MRDHARQRRLPDAPPRRVGDPRERRRVLRVDQEREVLDRVLDLRPLVELRPADHLVGDPGPHEHVLEHPRLRVGPVEDGDLVARDALVHEPLDLRRHPPRLGELVRHLAHADLVPLPHVRPQVLGHLAAVVRDHRVRGVQDRLRGAVVLLQLHDVRVRVIVLELENVPDVRAAEPVDRVVGDEPARDEVVRVLDVEVDDRPLESDAPPPSRRRRCLLAAFASPCPGRTSEAKKRGMRGEAGEMGVLAGADEAAPTLGDDLDARTSLGGKRARHSRAGR